MNAYIAKAQIEITKLASPEYSGDWHDKPQRYAVNGPGREVQKFSTKKDALLYRRLRSRMTEREAHTAFVNA